MASFSLKSSSAWRPSIVRTCIRRTESHPSGRKDRWMVECSLSSSGSQKQDPDLSPSVHQPLVAQLVKNPPAMRETWVRSLGREDPLEKRKGYPVQCSGLKNSMDCIVHRVAKSWTRLSNFHFTSYFSHFIFPSSI